MRYVLILLYLSVIPAAAGILLSDDFEDGNADGWTELNPEATYFVGGGWYHMINALPDQCSAGSYSGDQGGVMSVSDYSFLTEIYPRDGVAGPSVRYDPTDGSGYWLAMNPAEDGIALVKISGTSGPVILATASMSLAYLEYYWMRVEISGDMLGGKVWAGEVADEPVQWMITATDGSITQPGSVCLYANDSEPGGTATVHNDYDNIVVTDEVTLEMRSLTWAGIKSAVR